MAKEKKTWRMTEREFNRKVDEFLKTRVEEVFGSIDTYFRDNQIIMNRRYSAYTTSTGDARRQAGLELVSMDTNFWAEWSLHPQSFDDIVFYNLMNAIYNTGIICISYMCGNNLFTDEELEELMFIYSGMFKFEYWDDEHVRIVADIVAATPERAYELLSRHQFDQNVSFRYECMRQLREADTVRDKNIARIKTHISKAMEEYKAVMMLDEPTDIQELLGITRHVISEISKNDPELCRGSLEWIRRDTRDTFKNRSFGKSVFNPVMVIEELVRKAPKDDKKVYDYISKSMVDKLETCYTTYTERLKAASMKCTNKCLELDSAMIPKFVIDDRLDWYAISHTKLSKAFITKYDRLFRKASVIHNNDNK